MTNHWTTKKSLLSALFGLLVIDAHSSASAQTSEYLPIPPQSLEISEGSPLDFSSFLSKAAAGSEGWVLPGPDHHLHFGSTGRRAKFSCAMAHNGPHVTYEFHQPAEADRYAVQLRRHGYDLLRFQYLDARLMAKRTADFDIDPGRFDRFQYLLATLAKNGIYWGIDLLSLPTGLAAAPGKNAPPDSVRSRMLFDPEARAHWLKAVDLLYGRRNPYTGRTTLEDPALAFVITYNENSLAFSRTGKRADGLPFPTGIEVPFNDWLAKQYPNTKALSREISDMSADESLEDRTIRLPKSWDEASRRMVLFHRFVTKIEIETYDWTVTELRKRGFMGVVLSYDDYYSHINNATRSHLPAVDVHGYTGSVTDYTLGIHWKLGSSLEKSANDWRALAANRWLDRPFTVTEYGQSFWNPHRYEAGVTLPAIAALQDWDLICRTAHSSIELDIPDPAKGRRPIMPYSIGLDPVARAGETVAALLFARGDVRPALHEVAIPFGPEQFKKNGTGNLPIDLRLAVLLTRFGLQPSNRLSELPPEATVLELPSDYGARYSLGAAFGRAIEPLTGNDRAKRLVDALRERGVLGATNRTNPDLDYYESETGEFILDGTHQSFFVKTEMTEAAAMPAGEEARSIGHATVERLTSDALLAISALDGSPVVSSRRLLIVLAGDAANSNMIYADERRTALKSWGRLPLLLERVRAKLTLETVRRDPAHLTVLGLDGSKMASMQVVERDGKVSFNIDTGLVPERPTTYFLLEFGTVR